MSVHRLAAALAALFGLCVADLPIAAGNGALAQGAATVPAATINTMLVLDGSNSMKGRLPGGTDAKFDLARTALASALADGRFRGRFGVAGFGLRRPADCTDAFLVMAPAAPDAGAVTSALERQKPGGYSPVFPALREAAKALGSGTAGSVVIVLDDLASCREDPCAVAAEMKRDFPKLTVHAVGLGLRKEDASRLACLLRDTGGRLFDAQEAADVAPMIRAALQASATTADVAPPPPKVEPVEPDRPGLRLSVAIGSAQTSIELPVRYTVSRDEAGTDMLADIVAPTLDLDLDPGRYYVAVTAGLVETRRVVDVKAGPAPRVTLQLEAGVLDVTTPLTKGAASSATATVTVTNQNPRATARASYPLILGATVSDLVLPSGSWLLTARDGLAKAERTISITDGTHSDVELPLDAGRLSIQVTSPAGAGPSRNATLVAILEDDPDSPGGRREVARTLAPTAEFVLPSGTYTVLARSGSVETRERVSLRAGETAVRTLTVQMARLAVSMKVAPESEDGAQWRLSRADTGRDVGRAAEPSPSFEVPAGTYRLEARLGAQNAVLTRDVDLKAGSDQRLVVDVPAGRLRLRLAEAIAGLGFSEVFWEISDDKGAPVWRTGTAEPALTLAPGRYRMRVETRERALTGTFDVRAGENRTIEIGG